MVILWYLPMSDGLLIVLQYFWGDHPLVGSVVALHPYVYVVIVRIRCRVLLEYSLFLHFAEVMFTTYENNARLTVNTTLTLVTMQPVEKLKSETSSRWASYTTSSG
ncbi:hypothetical protein BDF20DRAFT_837560 [Mycotypha africana]|uniref:uncharacterized protein n=1 Tax=Mycotypha africana TaxID=64632 RepID=UPI002300FD30|nr:uncharacterized protein BDF20DRAFT_837560 [Mycotypha africana]KAI8973632.1 hypothetical protein BDF20DRAFT_837560 [Mycotypha africana]